uniref:PIR Superfamily Protein n=1 Tax=Meloidogyne hapla TaxID=6305 RepID=A0A1I8BKK1_MELHA
MSLISILFILIILPQLFTKIKSRESFANTNVNLSQFIPENSSQNNFVESNYGKVKSHKEQAKHRKTKEEYDNHYLMHDYCNMFLPHLEHPKLATDEKKDGKTQYKCTVPTEKAKVGEIVAMMKTSPNYCYLLGGF